MEANSELPRKLGGHKTGWMPQIRGPLWFCLLAKGRQQEILWPKQPCFIGQDTSRWWTSICLFFFNYLIRICWYLAWLLSFMEKGGSVKLVQEPGIHRWWEDILNSECTGAKGQLPVLLLQEETAEAFARELKSLKELSENVSSSQRPWLQTQTALSCLAGKGEPPGIRLVVIWKIIANFFHPLSRSLCTSYL